MRKILFTTAVLLAGSAAAAQVPALAPLDAVLQYESAVGLGKMGAKDAAAALQARKCALKTDTVYESEVTGADGKPCFGADKVTVSFLGNGGVSDSLTVQWNFKSRDDMTAFRDKLKQELAKRYGQSTPLDPGHFFIKGDVFRTAGQTVFFSWDTYGEWSRVEVVDNKSEQQSFNLAKDIRTLVQTFPQGKGKAASLDGFAASLGCRVSPMGHPRWLTLRNKFGRECRGLNVYFKLDADKSEVTEVKLAPAKADDENFERVQKAMAENFGAAGTVRLAPFGNEGWVYRDGDTALLVSKVKNKDRLNADIYLLDPSSAASRVMQPKDKVK
jgi:hypothetical protein